jgi:glycerate dehydrogenase
MKVLAFDIRQTDPPDYSPFAWVTMDEAFAKADVMSLNCALTTENREMVNAASLAKMKKSAFLINAARGGLVNEKDLAAALDEGQIAGAAVDVVSAEPIRESNPLLKAKNCIITPHIAWASLESRQRLKQTSIDNVRAYLSGKNVNRII